jgi:hypothetical protein
MQRRGLQKEKINSKCQGTVFDIFKTAAVIATTTESKQNIGFSIAFQEIQANWLSAW